MAPETVILQQLGILFFNQDRLMKILQREPFGVVVTILRFGEILREERVRHMAIVTGSNRVMRSLLPRIELVVHNMTVAASTWIAGEIGGSCRVVKGESPKPQRRSGKKKRKERERNKLHVSTGRSCHERGADQGGSGLFGGRLCRTMNRASSRRAVTNVLRRKPDKLTRFWTFP